MVFALNHLQEKSFIIYCAKVTKRMPLSLDKRVLGYIRTHPKCQQQAVQRALSATKQAISQILYALEAKKLIQRTFSNPPLWCLYQKPLTSSLRSSGNNSDTPNTENRLSNSGETVSRNSDYLPPVSLLNFIAAKYSLEWNLEEQCINQNYQVTASLIDPTNASCPIQRIGDTFASVDTARYSATIKLLDAISKCPQLPFSDLAVKFMTDVSKPERVEHCKLSIQDMSLPETSPEGFSPLFSPFSMLGDEEINSLAAFTVGDLYSDLDQNEEEFVLFQVINRTSFDFKGFQLCFAQVAWPVIASFINRHANTVYEEEKVAKIVYGVSEQRVVQGIPLFVPTGFSKDDIIRQKRENMVNLINEKSKTSVQPPEAYKQVDIQVIEALARTTQTLSNEQYIYVIVEVVITIPKFPTICAVHDTFYYHKNGANASTVSKMTLQQLQTRFATPSFKLM